jgi:peptidoglycan-N-acetylglucosamine deacetylase
MRRVIKFSSILLGIILGGVALTLCWPAWLVSALAWYSPQVTYFVETPQPVVALTIDDGPDRVTTPKILEILEQYQAHATFFMISSRVKANEKLVRRVLAEQHEVGNHLTIDQPSIELSPAEFEHQLVEADEVLSGFTQPRWFRPGSGWFNAEMLSTVRRRHYRAALGSVYPFDPHIPSAWFATQHILWNVKPGAVIILHDCGSRGERTAEVLAAILPELQSRGFRVVTLSELQALSLTIDQDRRMVGR